MPCCNSENGAGLDNERSNRPNYAYLSSSSLHRQKTRIPLGIIYTSQVIKISNLVSILLVNKMKRFIAYIMVAVVAMFLTSCGGKGSSSSAPANVKAVAGDTSVTISWDAQPGVEYWIWKTVGTNIDIPSCTSACSTDIKATSPTVITGLTNGTTYAFTINGRANGGPGGTGSPSISGTPRLAGGLDSNGVSTWSSPGIALGILDLRGIAYGVPAINTLTLNLVNPGSTGVFVAAGNNGSLFSGIVSNTNGSISWNPSNYTSISANFNALTFNRGRFLAVGDGGTILLSLDGTTWTQEISGTTNNLYAVSNNGTGFTAIGANGTVITSADGIIWASAPIVTTNTLYGITIGNGLFVAVGANGTIITSPDGIIWQTEQTASPLPDLKGVAFGIPQLEYVYTTQNGYTAQNLPAATFVAVGVNGSLVTSPDGITWTTQNPLPSTSLNAVTYGHQFVAVGNGSSIFTSIDGLTWLPTQNYSALLPNLYAVMPALYEGGQFANQYVYSAVGANGTHLLAQ